MSSQGIIIAKPRHNCKNPKNFFFEKWSSGILSQKFGFSDINLLKHFAFFILIYFVASVNRV